MTELIHGDCLEVLRAMPDCSVDAVVTDPPYGLSFMGKKWDYDVPGVEVWAECLRVLKPGGHLLAFAGTRTQHRMAVRIEDAGFEIRDMIAWVYGCLSDDTEILTQNGWERYSIFKQSSIFTEQKILIYDIQNDLYKWEKPERWNEYCVEQDTAFRIQSDNTDQIVSRGHRCLVERGGELVFVQADELAGVEQMPILRDDFFSISETHKQILQQDLPGQNGNGADIDGQQIRPHRNKISRLWNAWRKKPGMEGWRNIFQAQREIRKSINQVCSMPSGVYSDGSERRVCNGTPPECCDSDWEVFNENGVRSSYQSRCNGQPTRESNAIQNERRPQEIRTRSRYQATLATITQIEYTGVIFCPTVSTGAFVARRNGKMFITGNSGFPKSLDVSKAIDKAAGAEREVVGKHANPAGNKAGGNSLNMSAVGMPTEAFITAPATEAAKQWQGWGTALKPALEPITVARKPLIGTVAENVLQHGTGAINVDGCRVGTEEIIDFKRKENAITASGWKDVNRNPYKQHSQGRWPANFIHDGSEEVTDLLGSAARFFYCAKASKRDRDEGCEGMEGKSAAECVDRVEGSAGMNSPRAGAGRTSGSRNSHPTIKPTDLMRYLCRLVTPPDGTVLDPFMGSGSTGKAAVLEGFRFIGIEREEEYCEIAKARIKHAQREFQIHNSD
jgi:DNA modification methylase